MKPVSLSENQKDLFAKYKLSIDQPSSFLVGPVGTGKTTSLNAFSDYYVTRLWTHAEITAMYERHGHAATDIIIDENPYLILDDARSTSINSFGTKLSNIYEALITAKLDRMTSANEHYAKVVREIEMIKSQWQAGKSPYTYDEYHYGVLPSREHALKNWENAIKSKIFVSTNMSSEEMKFTFGDKLIDRVKSQMKIVVFEGESFRKSLIA